MKREFEGFCVGVLDGTISGRKKEKKKKNLIGIQNRVVVASKIFASLIDDDLTSWDRFF